MIYSYSISKIREVAVGTIIYQLHVSALIGHLQVGIRQRKISIISIGMGGRDLVYKYRVSHELRSLLRDSVPYVKVYRYNPKHLYPKLNGYGDNGQRSLKL